MRILLVPLAVACAMTAFAARSEWSSGQGDYAFTTEMTEREACRRAERRAREAAVVKITGERLSSEDLLSCKERNSEAACALNRHTWSIIDGDIRAVRNKKKETIVVGKDIRQCHVSLEADVSVGSGRPDPSFDMTVKLNRHVYRSGEAMEIRINPTQLMRLYVFQWLPYETGDRQVSLIYPNKFDNNNRADSPTTIPSANGRNAYSMQVNFPNNRPRTEKSIDEFLMVIGTRARMKFRNSYGLDEFKSRLLELPRSEWRQVKRVYSVVRDN